MVPASTCSWITSSLTDWVGMPIDESIYRRETDSLVTWSSLTTAWICL